MAVTGEGVYSWGTKHAFGSSLFDYLYGDSIGGQWVPGQIEMRNVEINIIKASAAEGSLAIRYFMNERNKGYSIIKGHTCATAVGIGLKDGLNLDIFISIFPSRIQKEAYRYSDVDISFPRGSDFDDTYDIYDRYLSGYEKSWW